MDKTKMKAVIKAAIILLAKSDAVINKHNPDSFLPLLTLMAQELQLQRLKMSGQTPAAKDLEYIGNMVYQIQQNSMSYPVVYVAFQLGYLIATDPDRLHKLVTDLETTMREYRNSTTLL